jgi:hypothetical protein
MLKQSGQVITSTEDISSPAGVASRYLDFVTLDGRIYGFPMAHLVNYILEANSDTEGDNHAPPDRLTLYFSSHDVVLLGWRLKRLVHRLKGERLSSINTVEARYAKMETTEPLVCEINMKVIAER